jgi:hypothetical protein
MVGLKFTDRRNRTVTVENIEDNIASLNNGERVSVERLKDPNFYSPVNNNNKTLINENNSQSQIPQDLDSFNNSRYKKMLEGSSLKVGEEEPSTQLQNSGGGQRWNQNSQISSSGDVVESHSRNLKSMGINPPDRKQDTPVKNQSEDDILRKYENLYQQPKNKPEEKTTDKKTLEDFSEENVDETPVRENKTMEKTTENPVFQMFDKAKKTHPLKLNLKIDEKIPNKTVIKMMEENFEESAIDYYSKMIFKKIMEDPTIIEKQIKESITKYVNSKSSSTNNTTNKKKTSQKK